LKLCFRAVDLDLDAYWELAGGVGGEWAVEEQEKWAVEGQEEEDGQRRCANAITYNNNMHPRNSSFLFFFLFFFRGGGGDRCEVCSSE
jgi:hypothetical protein